MPYFEGAPSLKHWRSMHGPVAVGVAGQAQSLYVGPIDIEGEPFPGNILASTLGIGLSVTHATGSTAAFTSTYHVGLYTRNASTLSLINSVSGTWGTAGANVSNTGRFNGARILDIFSSAWSSAPWFREGSPLLDRDDAPHRRVRWARARTWVSSPYPRSRPVGWDRAADSRDRCDAHAVRANARRLQRHHRRVTNLDRSIERDRIRDKRRVHPVRSHRHRFSRLPVTTDPGDHLRSDRRSLACPQRHARPHLPRPLHRHHHAHTWHHPRPRRRQLHVTHAPDPTPKPTQLFVAGMEVGHAYNEAISWSSPTTNSPHGNTC